MRSRIVLLFGVFLTLVLLNACAAQKHKQSKEAYHVLRPHPRSINS